jgi:hypothetical protein
MGNRTYDAVVSSAVITRLDDLDREMECIDMLPPLLRRAIHDNNIKMSAVSILQYILMTPEFLVQEIRKLEAAEIIMFGREVTAVYKYPYAHTAAQATIMRYGDPIPKARNRNKTKGYKIP